MVRVDVNGETSELIKKQTYQGSCYQHWVGKATKLCPHSYYNNCTDLLIRSILATTAIASFGLLIIGTIWVGYLNNSGKIVIVSLAIAGLVSSLVYYIAHSILFHHRSLHPLDSSLDSPV